MANAEILLSHDSAIAANTAKTGITSAQASAITANTAKVGMTLGTTSSTALAGDALSGDVQIGNSPLDKIGFYGANPVSRKYVYQMPDNCLDGTCPDFASRKINEIIDALENMGLIN